MRPVPGAALLAALGAAALLAHHWTTNAAIAVLLFGVCLSGPRGRRWPYLVGALTASASVFVVSPFLQSNGWHVLWSGPSLPVIGQLDVTREEVGSAAVQALRLGAVGLAFAAYALLLDLDRLVQAAAIVRRSALAAALAIRLVPTLERDAVGLVEALRGRGIEVGGLRGHARLLSPLLAGSLERGLNLAEAMEARGYGRRGRTRVPAPPWRVPDYLGLAGGALLVVGGALWL